MEPLHRLPTGEWIDLTTIGMVSAHKRGDWVHSVDRVIITKGDDSLLVPFESFPEAQSYADELAALVNVARMGRDA